MKVITLAFLLAGSGMAYGQTPAPQAPNPPPDFFRFFQAPETRGQRFKLQIPNARDLFQSPPGLQKIPSPGKASNLDDGILRRPKGFARRAPRSPLSRNLYPDLKVLPIEIATTASAPGPRTGVEPIPRAWPKAKIEPIPITWDEFRVLPIHESAVGRK